MIMAHKRRERKCVWCGETYRAKDTATEHCSEVCAVEELSNMREIVGGVSGGNTTVVMGST